MNVQRVNQLEREREALAIAALGYFTGLRQAESVPPFVREEAQRIEDKWNALTVQINEALTAPPRNVDTDDISEKVPHERAPV